MKELPWRCPEHPDAKIRHEYDVEKICWNGLPGGEGIPRNHHYFCDECGRELLAPKGNPQ